MGFEEEIDIFLKWKQEGQDVASDAAARIDRISDAATRYRATMDALGVAEGSRLERVLDAYRRQGEAFDAMTARLKAAQETGLFNLGRPGSGNDPIQLGSGADPHPLATLLRIEQQLATRELEKQNVEVERQHNWWLRIRETIRGVRDWFSDINGILGMFMGGGSQESRSANFNLVQMATGALKNMGDYLQKGENIPWIGGIVNQIGEGLSKMATWGPVAIPILAIVISIILALVVAIGTLVAGLTVLIAYVGAAATILGTFVVAGAGTLLFLGLLGGGFAAAAAAIVWWGIQLQGGVGAAGALTSATKGLQTAQEGLDASQLAISKWWAAHPYGPQNQKDVLTLQGLTDRLRDSQEKLTTAQNAYNTSVANSQSPLQNLIATLDVLVAEKLEPLAVKISNVAINWLDAWALQIGPSVADTGTGIMTWVGDRIIPILDSLKRVVTALAPDFRDFGTFLGAMFDRIGSGGRYALFENMAENGVRLAITAVETLLGWLEQLTNWFLGKGPDGVARFMTYGGIVREILGGLASLIATGVLPAFGRFADWVVANWPSIKGTVEQVFSAISTAWNALKPILETLIPIFQTLWLQIQLVATNSDNWRAVLIILYAAIVLIAGTLLLFFAAILLVDQALKPLRDTVKAVGDFFNGAGTAVHNFQDALNTITVPGALIVAYNLMAKMNGWQPYQAGPTQAPPDQGGTAPSGPPGRYSSYYPPAPAPVPGRGGTTPNSSQDSLSGRGGGNTYNVSVTGANVTTPDATARSVSRLLRAMATT